MTKNIEVIKNVNWPVRPIVRNILITIVTVKIPITILIKIFFELKNVKKDKTIANDKYIVYCICVERKGTGFDSLPVKA